MAFSWLKIDLCRGNYAHKNMTYFNAKSMHFLHITVIGVNVFCSLEISTKKRKGHKKT